MVFMAAGASKTPNFNITVEEDWRKALRLVRRVMGFYNYYYASATSTLGARGLVAKVNGVAAGSVVFYAVELELTTVGVIYYVVVKPQFRGLGLSRVLIASAEVLMESDYGAECFIATTTSDNLASIRAFAGLGYEVRSLSGYGEGVEDEFINLVACAYEDDVAMVKGDLRLTDSDMDRAYEVWRRACYEPWLRMWRSPFSYKPRL